MSAPADDERFAYFVVFDFHNSRPHVLRATVVNVTATGVRFAKPVPLENRDRITMEAAKVDYTPAAALARAYAGAEQALVAAHAIVADVESRVAALKAIESAAQLAIEEV